MDYYDVGLCGGLAAAGIDVVLHTCDETPIDTGQAFEIRHTYNLIYGKDPAWKRGLRFIRGSLRAVGSSVLEGRKLLHLHFFNVSPLGLMNVLLAKFAGRKIVITTHDVEAFVSRLEVPFMSRMAYRLSHQIIAHNQVSRDEVVRCTGVPEQKVAVIASGNYLHVAGHSPSLEDARNRLGIPLSAKVLLFFGQIKQVKRLDLLLDAMPAVIERHPDAMLLIAGRPWKTDFSSYQAQIDRLGIGDSCMSHIRFIGDDELPYYYAAADLVVLPYGRIYQSAVVLMAMSFGKAVLVSDLPGMTEIVTDGVNGYVFKEGQLSDLVEKLNFALDNKAGLQSVAEQGLQHMRDNYDWNKIGYQTAQIYGKLIS